MKSILLSILALISPALAHAQDASPMQHYGVYSHKAAKKHGTFTYSTPDGKHIIVTTITQDPKFPTYHWDDAVLVGPVADFIGHQAPGASAPTLDPDFDALVPNGSKIFYVARARINGETFCV